jgi:hypothetical protein
MDWGQSITTGFATGVGVIFAQKFVNWLDRHQMTKEVKKVVNDITHNR